MGTRARASAEFLNSLMSELVAVACVVESSLVLAAEWPRLLLEYLSPLLKRLGEAHAANQSTMVCSPVLLYGYLALRYLADSFV